MPYEPPKSLSPGVIYEMILQGAYVKVSAVDTETGTEVSIVGDPAAGPAILKKQALAKLMRMLARNAGDEKNPGAKSRSSPPSGWDL